MGEAPQVKVFTEKRGGKTVTIVKGLHTYGSARLEDIAKEIKTRLACGGSVKDGLIVIQGDKREQVMERIRLTIKK